RSKIEHGHQALAAGQHLGVVSVLRERGHRLGDGPRREIVEGRGLHARPPARPLFARAAPMRSRTVEGPSGARVTRTPKGDSASSTALASAAGGEIAPPSPMPLTPSGFRGDGYSRCTVSMGVSSMAVGTR